MNQLWILRFAPALFVFLWSTGFIGAKYGMSGAEPFTYLTLRFFIAFVLIAFIACLFRAVWPVRRTEYVHHAVVGCLVQGVYLGGVFAAVYHGLPAGVSAIIVGLSPLVTALAAWAWLGEGINRVNVVGLLLGFVGLLCVIGGDQLMASEATASGVLLCLASLFAISLGTLYQKRFCADADLLSGTAIQYLSATALLALPMLLLESREIQWTAEVLGALLWLVLALSVVAVLLLMLMIKHGEANRVASLFYLVPALATLEAWLLFDETISLTAIFGIVLCTVGVYLARIKISAKRAIA